MNEDHLDALMVEVIQQVEDDANDPDLYNDDHKFERLERIFYRHLEKFFTTERNYN